MAEDCFLNAVEDLSDYKGNEHRGSRDAALVDPVLMQASKAVFLMHLNDPGDDLHFE